MPTVRGVRALKTGSRSFELSDSSVLRIPAVQFIKGPNPRDPTVAAANLGRQFLELNRSRLALLDVGGTVSHTGHEVEVALSAASVIGTVPLASPASGKFEHGLVVRPRFEWAGLGQMLSLMGWRIVPELLALPNSPNSDRRVPPWLLSSVVLHRLQALLESLTRRFQLRHEERLAPRGRVQWGRYATTSIPRGKFLAVPCSFPDLNVDRELRGAIHFVLLKQLESLGTQRGMGLVVAELISLCESLIDKVRGDPPVAPSPLQLERWERHQPFAVPLRQAIEGMRWTMDERGLGGMADLAGLPWRMSMTEFFEAYVEALASRLVPLLGGTLRSGRRRQTVSPIAWEPPFRGSQKYLLPDVVVQGVESTIIFDAKYKEHWEELNVERWTNIEEELRERHRADLLQILAYSTLFATGRITCCLVYPCTPETWQSLHTRGQLFHRAVLGSESRPVNLILTAAPLGTFFDAAVKELAGVLRAT